MNVSAANALLKILEEPPAQTVFMGGQFNFEFLEPTAIADAIAYAVSQPENVAVNEIIVRPLQQPQ